MGSKSRRNSIMIAGEVLNIAKESGNGINHTSLLRRANLSHGNLLKIVSNLTRAGLVDEKKVLYGAQEQRIYSITEKGREFLLGYERFAELSDAFGLHL